MEDNQFSWIPFYTELADKLLAYKNRRKELLDIVYYLDDAFVHYLSDNGKHFDNIDPFSVFGIFNRGTNKENRIKVCEIFKSKFNIKSEVPQDFAGIPVLMPLKSYFFYKSEKDAAKAIEYLWNLFESAINKNENDFDKYFDLAQTMHGIKWNIKFGLFWIRPNDFIALDGNNRKYLQEKYHIEVSEEHLKAANYRKLKQEIKAKMQSGEIEENTFPDFSYDAWLFSNNKEPKTDRTKDKMKLDKYISLLKDNHNLILTGAPGTGKTHLAKQIACQMRYGKDYENLSAEDKKDYEKLENFVQFHPSYDYTDFVEGLRPEQDDNGNMGFERRDGVFKEFCKKALDVNYSKAVNNFDESWEKLLDLVKNNLSKNQLTKIGSWDYSLSTKDSLKYNSTNTSSQYSFTITKQNIKDVYQHKQARPSGAYQKDMEDIVNYMKQNTGLKENQQKFELRGTNNKPFIFIIDEINRGEISKIFGELFFSIDPGYRGEKGKVQTQYQNLIEDDDPFKSGFYVPENVYIIGTMNDIDRSVESMDFAMRRRFAWYELTADESAENMKLSEEAKARMKRLNTEISKIEDLNDSYFIGGAYFCNCTNFDELWNLKLCGLLKEYLRGTDKVNENLKKLKAAYDNEIDSSQE